MRLLFFAPLLLFFLLRVLAGRAQTVFNDDFSDGEFTSNPAWSGTDSKFIVEGGRLHLKAPPETGDAYLVYPSDIINNAEWDIEIELDHNPSSQNYVKIYLVADQPDLSGMINGYYVQVGNSADEVSLYRQEGMTSEKIMDGRDKTVDSNLVRLSIKVTRDLSGHWLLFSDVGVSGNFVEEGEVFDDAITLSSFFGVYCKYSASYSDEFWFDNMHAQGAGYVDVIPPVLDSLVVISQSRLRLLFSESLNPSFASNASNYLVDNGIGSPQYASISNDSTQVDLLFTKDFKNGIENHIFISGLSDPAGNALVHLEKDFVFFHPHPVARKDVIINEIFPDPDPPVGLPDEEFVEIMNRSENPIDLEGWTLADDHSTAELPHQIILPESYWIITSQSVVDAFNVIDNVIGVSKFPGLNNAGDQLFLRNNDGLLVDEVVYDRTWFHDEDKDMGGWSLELIDPYNMCAEGENWSASIAPAGGTPSRRNSIFAIHTDVEGPRLLHAVPLNDTTIYFEFDEKLNAALPVSDSFQFNPPISILKISFYDSTMFGFVITCEPLMKGTLYGITLDGIRDCPGNLIETDSNRSTFGLPEPAEPGDVVINEILFNPTPTGVDFVELYNVSGKFLNLRNWSISNGNDSTLVNQEIICKEDYLLAPHSYRAFTENKMLLASEYINASAPNIMEVEALPPFPNNAGSVVLTDSSERWLDYFRYDESMHSPFLNNKEGVSLERLDATAATQDANNWKSSGSSNGFATPGYVNSNTTSDFISDSEISIDPEIFRPGNGSPDHTLIHYKLDRTGYVGTVVVYDISGRKINTLAENEVLGTSGFFRWDGEIESGEKAGMGYYYVLFDAFDRTGKQIAVIKRVIIADQL